MSQSFGTQPGEDEPDNISESGASFLLPAIPDGHMTIAGLARELGATYALVKRAVTTHAETIGEPIYATLFGSVSPLYNEDQKQAVRSILEERGAFMPLAPKEGYQSVRMLAIELKMDRPTAAKYIDCYGAVIGEMTLFRSSKGPAPFISDEQKELLIDLLTRDGIIGVEPLEGYVSLSTIAERTGMSRGYLKESVVPRLGVELGTVLKHKHGPHITGSFSPDQQKIIIDSLSGEYPAAPEGYVSLNALAQKEGAYIDSLQKVVTGLGSVLTDVKKYRFNARITEGYSPHDQNVIVNAYHDSVYSQANDERPSVADLAAELDISAKAINAIIRRYGEGFGTRYTGIKNSRVATVFSDEQVSFIRDASHELRTLDVAPEGFRTIVTMAVDVKVHRFRLMKYVDDSIGQPTRYLGKNRMPGDYYSPDQQAAIIGRLYQDKK